MTADKINYMVRNLKDVAFTWNHEKICHFKWYVLHACHSD